jgi:hypothetical protein
MEPAQQHLGRTQRPESTPPAAACWTFGSECCTGEARVGGEELHAVLPLGHGALWAWQARPWVMGILNVTPDSFSDGGAYLEVPGDFTAFQSHLRPAAHAL